jgi:hypothetical protein
VRSYLVAAIVLASGTSLAKPKPAKHAAKPHHVSSRFEAPSDADDSPAVRYGRMSQTECEAELNKRSIKFHRETAKGVAAPVRLDGALHGVEFRTDQSDAQRAESPWEIADCRLILAMDDFSAMLEQHGVVQVRHYSMYRAPPKSWPDDKIGTRHNGALALDAARFTTKDGTKLSVLDDFHGAIGDKTCGDGAGPRHVADKDAAARATEIRAILCEAVSARLFNVVLTPNYNKPHRNHFHLEVTAGVKWFLVH